MLEHRSLADIAGVQAGWLNAKHHFAVGSYGNPAHHPVGELYVWNDDSISPHAGFPLHAHADVEIITYVREGAITHKDDLGNQGVTRAGDVQVMSAGTGIRHAEHNDEDVTTRIFQIWLHPRQRGGVPQWGCQALPQSRPLGPARAACQRERRLGGLAGRRRCRNLRGHAGWRGDDLLHV